jgi:hypothetical protein
MAGSVLGGRWSDFVLARLKMKRTNSYPEMRLESVIYGIPLLPMFVVGFGWVLREHVHVAVVCIILFFCGFCAA